jgi:ferrochelatase
MNMGGPNNISEVKVFLRNMFNDKYIIGAPQPIRALIGQIIISKRLKESQENYGKLGGMSPIVGHTKRLVRRLNKELDADVFYEMRYTPPFASDIMPKLKNYDEIYAIPMYPHYSSTTTKSSIEEFMKVAKKYNLHNKIKTIDSYYDILQKHILANVECAKKELIYQGINFKKIHVAYQSRLGPMEWLRPYMEDKLKEIKSKVIIYPISFTVDNSETQYELDMEYLEVAHKLGIKDYRVAKAPNHHKYFMDAIKEIYEKMK